MGFRSYFDSSSSGGGGGGTPGGVNGDLQYNNAGAFGGLTPGVGVATLLAGTPSGTGGLAGTTSPTFTTQITMGGTAVINTSTGGIGMRVAGNGIFLASGMTLYWPTTASFEIWNSSNVPGFKLLNASGLLAIGFGSPAPTYGFQLQSTSGLTANFTMLVQDAGATGSTGIFFNAGASQSANPVLTVQGSNSIQAAGTVKGILTTLANAVTGLVAGALAALTNASLVITDGAGTVYRIPCVTP